MSTSDLTHKPLVVIPTEKHRGRVEEFIDFALYGSNYLRENRLEIVPLLPYIPGPNTTGKCYGDGWHDGVATARARDMYFKGRRVVLMGRHVGRAFFPKFFRDPAFLQWLKIDRNGTQLVVAPLKFDLELLAKGSYKFFWRDLLITSEQEAKLDTLGIT